MISASRTNLVSHSAGVIKTQSRESALDKRLTPGVLILKINRMNNEANDANDNGEDFDVGLPETERQELIHLRCEVAIEIQRLRQERGQLLLERQRELELLEQQGLLWEQMQRDQDDIDAWTVRVARRQQPPQRQAFETRVLERQQQQQVKSVEGDAEEDAETVSLSMVEPNP